MIATPRRRLIAIPARLIRHGRQLIRHGRQLILRLPPGHYLLAEILARLRSLPAPA